jgi:hypothetical protein
MPTLLVTATDSGVERIRRKPVLNGLINDYMRCLTLEEPRVSS